MTRTALLFVGLLLTPALLHAETPSSPPPTAEASSVTPMEDPQLGDHWTFETRDEVTGDIKATVVQTITDVTATEVSLRTNAIGNPNLGFLVYDRNWNVTNNGNWKYTPNDGSGVRLPLAVGKT